MGFGPSAPLMKDNQISFDQQILYFSTFDTGRDGSIDRGEFAEAMKRFCHKCSQEPLSQHRCDVVFDTLDSNGDSRLTLYELVYPLAKSHEAPTDKKVSEVMEDEPKDFLAGMKAAR